MKINMEVQKRLNKEKEEEEELLYTEEDKKLIRRDYRRLLKGVTMNNEDKGNIRMAFHLAVDAHQRQRRKSGEPYVLHPIEVARICVEEIGLGPTAVICALLHDVVEDTSVTLAEIEAKFGSHIAAMVDGLTKLEDAINLESPQAENFKKILKTLTTDVRVVLIKMSDRLHNMRTLGSMPIHKQYKIASETAFIYAPLAHRLGLYDMKTEFQDMCMKVTDYENYKMVANQLSQTKKQRDAYINSFISPIKEKLNHLKRFEGNFEIYGRAKSIYSIWKKIQNKKVAFEEIYDLFAIRIIVDTPIEKEKFDCWKIYSIVTDTYRPIPERLKDWVSTPKSNGYESLHTTVVGPSGRFVEVQIRTKRMNEIAEKGFAAHWKYKEIYSENVFDHWVNSIRNILENPAIDAIDFVKDIKSSLFSEEVFVYTPKGDMKMFPKGATPLDFAFSIHTHIGSKCTAAKINGRLVPLDYQLQNGDKVAIFTSNTQIPNKSWLDFVITSKAKNAIRNAMNEQKRKDGEDGRDLVARKFKSMNVLWSDENIDFLLRKGKKDPLKIETRLDLFFEIAENKNLLLTLLKETKVESGKLVVAKAVEVPKRPVISIPKGGKPRARPKLLINGEDAEKFSYSFSRCCNPVQGDSIFAFAATGGGAKIHRTTCPNATDMMAHYGYRIMRAEWGSTEEASFVAELKVIGIDSIGVIQTLTNVITNDLKLNMRSMSISANAGFYEGLISLVIDNFDHLQFVMKKLKEQDCVNSVARID